MAAFNRLLSSATQFFVSSYHVFLKRGTPNQHDAEVSPLKSHYVKSAALNPSLIKFLNWNAYKGVDSQWLADFNSLVHEKDLIVIQEIAFTRQLQAVLHERSLSWRLTKSFDHKHGVTGVLTASTSSASQDRGLHSKEPLIRLPKSSLVTWYPLEGVGNQLLVANIHSVNFSVGVKAFRHQLEMLEHVIEGHQGPVILSGDFNTWRYKRYEVLNKIVSRLKLTPVRFFDDNRRTVLGMPLDHIFYRGLEEVRHNVPVTLSSDHQPMEVDFRIATAD